MITKKALRADSILQSVSRQMPFTIINPENAESIKRKFLKKPYEPTFSYGQLPDLSQAKKELEELNCGISFYGKLLEKERKYLLDKIAMIESIGTPLFGHNSKDVYGVPSNELVEQAKEFLKLSVTKTGKNVSYEKVQELMKHTFSLLGFTYNMRRKDMVSSAYLSSSKRQLHLKKKARFSQSFAHRLAVHEIATHALRAENAREHKLGIFVRGTPNYLATEEGLAAYNEERAGVMNTNILRIYAGRVIAVHLAETHTFVETYKKLLKHFEKKDAFTLTLRAKRGLDNGESRGGCTKDYAYLQGYLAIKEYVAQGRDLKELYKAKISLEDIELLENKLPDPKYIPEPVIEWVRQKNLTDA